MRSLETEKQEALERIKLLEGGRSDEDDLEALAIENEELKTKLSTYLEEMEDMDSKMEMLEKENSLLKKSLDTSKDADSTGGHFDYINELETERQDLNTRLEEEKRNNENLQHQLQTLKTEMENNERE